MDCLFCKIVVGEVFVCKFYEDEEVVVFYDIGLQVLVYFLVILKRYIFIFEYLIEVDWLLVGYIFFIVQCLVWEQGCEEGFCVVMNCNDFGGQIVYYIYMYVLG